MARRNPPPRPPRVVRLGAAAAVIVASGLGAAVGVAPGGAIGPPIVRAEPAPDLARARELYQSAEAAMEDGRYDDAARDYGAAYELSADPALFYKIGRASERAGKCDVALSYYARYLREGKPTEQFTALTRERMAACGGDRAGGSAGAGSDAAGSAGGAAGPAGGGPTATGAASSQASGAGAGSATGASSSASSGPAGATQRSAAPSSAGSPPSGAGPGSAGSAAASTAATGAERTAPPASPAGGPATGSGSSAAALIPPTREKIAWLMGGGAIALVTLGGVLAYAASSSENDVRDLYAGFAGQPPMFDAQTRKRYDDLVDQGRNYQHLSWAAFGLGGAAAVGAAVLFALGRGDEPGPPHAPAVTPVVGPRGAGVSVRF
jgi:tetratricopeptide (TPR) repeat protein